MQKKFRYLLKNATLALIYKLPPFPQQIHGRTIWVHPRALLSISARTFFKGESHVRKWVTEHLQSGDVFLDIGAHHGWFSMWAISLVGTEGEVYSFEPSPANLLILEWHKEKNNFCSWSIVAKAASNVDSTAMEFFLTDGGDSPINSLTNGAPGMTFMEGRNTRTINIQTITLDTFCKETDVSPNLVKIDAEGAELMVLQGSKKLLSETHPDIILAVHPYWLPKGQSTRDIADLLFSFGYTIFDSTGVQVKTFHSGEYLCLHEKSDGAMIKVSPE